MDPKEIADKEGIREVNRLAIINGIQQLLANPDIKEGTSVSTNILGSKEEMVLDYITERTKINNYERFFIQIGLIDPKTGRHFATRDCSYQIYQQNSNEIEIEGNVWVKEGQMQKQGYGSGLLLCTNIVLEDAVRRYSEFRGKLVTAKIVDASFASAEDGEDIVGRKGWSSYFAKKLGYAEIEEGIWEKVYQYASESK